MGTVLIIEDYPSALKILEWALQGEPYTIKTAATFQDFQSLLEGLEMPLVVLVDEEFPGGNGAQVAQILRDKMPGVKLISTSSNADDENRITWEPDVRLQKPFLLEVLRAKVEALMKV